MFLRRLVKRIKDARGAATSLVEAGLTIGVGAALAGAALTGGLDATDGANYATAKEQAGQIAQAVVSFASDIKVLPGWKNGNNTGPSQSNATYTALVSEEGTYPLVGTTNASDWGGGFTGSAYTSTLTGDKVNSGANHDAIENHLDRNAIGFLPEPTGAGSVTPFSSVASLSTYYSGLGLSGSFSIGTSYPGHKGNYLKSVNSIRFDPWYHKYLINAKEISVRNNQGAGGTDHGNAAVFVLSAGKDGVISTPEFQPGDSLKAFGDDVVVRIAVISF